MPTSLPPIPVDDWEQHVETTSQERYTADLAAIDQARAAQQRAEAHRVANDQRDEAEAQQRARAQIEAIGVAQARNQEEVAAQQQAAAQIDAIRAPVVPSAPAMPQGTAPRGQLSPGVEAHRAAVEAAFGDLGPGQVDTMLAIMERESGGNPAARKNDEVEDSQGIFQINTRAHPDLARKYDLSDPVQNARAAREVWNTQGNRAWFNASQQLGVLEGGTARPSGVGRQVYSYAAGEGPADERATPAGDDWARSTEFAPLGRRIRTAARSTAQPGAAPPMGFSDIPGQASYVEGPEWDASGGLARGPLDVLPGDRMTDVSGFDLDPQLRSSGPRRAEAVGQFEQGLPYEEAASICGPVAALAFVQANGRNPSLAEVRALAKRRGWTESGGMNGVANEQALLSDLGVASRLDTTPDFGEIAQDASSGNPVIISTGVHYYYANGYDPETGRLFVGKTGTSRKGGGSWMTPQQIADLDGGINGVLYVDNPGSPQPSVAASSGDSSGERPESEFEPPSAFPPDGGAVGRTWGDGGAVGGSWATDPVERAGLGRRRGEPLPDAPIPDAIGRGIEALGTVQSGVDQLTEASGIGPAGRAARERSIRREVELTGATPEEAARHYDQALDLATSFSGEPLSVVRGMGRAGSRLGQAGLSLEVTGGPDLPRPTGPPAPSPEVARLRLDKFPEEVRDVVQQAATEGDFWRTQRRGVIPDAEAEAMADRLGRSADEMIATGKAGRSYNAEETRALRNAVTSQAMRVNEINAQIAADPTAAPPRLVAEAVAEGMKLADLTRVAEGARAEAGRTFRAYRAFTRDSLADPGGAVERIFKAVGGPENATKAVQEYQKLVADGADVFKLAAFWARKESPPVGFLDWYELVRRNAMLSGPRTLLVNALSGGTEIPWKILGDAVDSSLRGRLRSEMTPELRAIWAGLRQGSEAAVQTLAHGITEQQALAGDVPRSISARVSNPLAKGAALALEAPMRGQQATDDVVRAIALRMHLAREAAQAANAAGLKGEAWSERVADLMQAPPPAMMKRADLAADDLTFKGEMGNLGRALTGVQRVPLVGPALIPFLKTVYNITARGIDRSPLGLLGTGVDVARGVYRGGKELPAGVRPLSARLRDNALGSAGSIWFYDQALRGNITGAGPDDPEKRRMLEAQGWQPYAVKLGGDYVSYTNWGPIAVPLSLMAGAAEAQTYAKPGKGDPGSVVGDALQRSVKVLTEQNYLQGVGAIYKTMTDYERYGHQWLTQYLSSLVPYGAAINTLGQATDPLVRQPERGDIGQAMRARFPTNPLFDARESVPAKQDVLGRDVVNEQQGLAAANPLRTREGRPDPVLTTLLDNGADIGAPPKEVRGVPLAPADQRRHQEIAGGLIASTVERITADPRFADLPPETRKKILQGAVERARSAAGGILFGELGSQELTRRMREKAGATR